MTIDLIHLISPSFNQEKIKRIQQIQMEKELRAQQILEVGPNRFLQKNSFLLLAGVFYINQWLLLNYVAALFPVMSPITCLIGFSQSAIEY